MHAFLLYMYLYSFLVGTISDVINSNGRKKERDAFNLMSLG